MTTLRDIVEADETFFLECIKGQNVLPRPARRRGGTASKPGLSAEQIPVLISRDRHGNMADRRLPNLSDKAIEQAPAPVVYKHSVLVSNGPECCHCFAVKADILLVSLNTGASQGPSSTLGEGSDLLAERFPERNRIGV